MRIHRLEMQAFGPFAERQVIDFDELGAHGLFLLNGPTGAGKTSVLDAVCYALYGTVPGARQQGRRLRSDHAAPDTAPEVVCEFSSGPRRFEVVRNPQWERPAKRAGGRSTVTEQAKTLLREYTDGAWVEKSTRNEEASAEITELLGMNRDQFTKVVLLPQGDFAAFLRADAAAREQLLQKLFGTSRFEDIERQLKTELAAATERFETAGAETAQVLLRARDEISRYRTELGAETVAEESDAPDITAFRTELAARTAAARNDLSRQESRREQAEKHLHELEHRRARGLALAQLARDEAEHERLGLTLEPQRAALARHTAAAGLAAYVRAEEAARGRAAARTAASTAALEELAGHRLARDYHVEASAALPAELESRVSEDLAAANAALEDELLVEELLSGGRDEAAAAETLRRTADAAARDLAALRTEETTLTAEAGELARQAEGESRAEASVAAAEELLSTISAYTAARTRAGELEQAAAEARQNYQDLRQAWQDLLQARLDQAAAELAQGLADGVPCPVCGGEDHPHPAVLPDGTAAVTREAEQDARAAADTAETAFEEARRRAGEAAEAAAALKARGGDAEPEAVQAQLDAARTELDQARGAGRKLEQARRRLEAIAADSGSLDSARAEALIQAAQAETRAVAARDRAAALSERVAEARQEFDSVGSRAKSLAGFARLAATAREAVAAAAAAGEELERVAADLRQALAGTAFSSAAEVSDALLDAPVADAYASALQEWEDEGRRLLLRREGQDAAADTAGDPEPVPDEEDVAEAAEAAAAARREQEESALLVRMLEASAVRLAGYAGELAEALEHMAPLRARRDLLQSVADTARGSGENDYKMTLSTYVLAARLEQVAAAATERLAAMTGGRYALVHSDSKSGNRKAGLGLHVTDEWTGQHRDTSTLSGGESFMASLALALGLADVVQQEAGGVNIETLFVDEGFGSLDEQSLEQVMDALESLRDGGRVVGLVSHVAEMKQRIPAQLQILKGRSGSTVRYTAGDAVSV